MMNNWWGSSGIFPNSVYVFPKSGVNIDNADQLVGLNRFASPMIFVTTSITDPVNSQTLPPGTYCWSSGANLWKAVGSSSSANWSTTPATTNVDLGGYNIKPATMSTDTQSLIIQIAETASETDVYAGYIKIGGDTNSGDGAGSDVQILGGMALVGAGGSVNLQSGESGDGATIANNGYITALSNNYMHLWAKSYIDIKAPDDAYISLSSTVLKWKAASTADQYNILFTGLYDSGSGFTPISKLGRGPEGYVLTTHVSGPPTWESNSATSGITSITAGTGLSGGTITTTGTIALAAIATKTMLSNTTSGSAIPVAHTLTQFLDAATANTAGGLLYRNFTTSAWDNLAPSNVAGTMLMSNGVGANPTYANWASVSASSNIIMNGFSIFSNSVAGGIYANQLHIGVSTVLSGANIPGALVFKGGDSKGTGRGGQVNITAGNCVETGTGRGGSIYIQSGSSAAGDTQALGGNIYLFSSGDVGLFPGTHGFVTFGGYADMTPYKYATISTGGTHTDQEGNNVVSFVFNLPGAANKVWTSTGTMSAPAWQTVPSPAYKTEVPSGLIDSANVTFTLPDVPVLGSLSLYLNGVWQSASSTRDYTLSGAVITFNRAPLTNSWIEAKYL